MAGVRESCRPLPPCLKKAESACRYPLHKKLIPFIINSL